MDRRTLTALVLAAAMTALSVPLVLGFLAPLHPALDSIGHFRFHLASAMSVPAALLLMTPFRREALAGLALAIGALFTTLEPGTLPIFERPEAEARPAVAPRATYSLLQFNLRFNNGTPERVLSLIGSARPDIVTLEEVSEMWEEKLGLLAAAYPNRIVCPRTDHVGSVAILSRRPFAPDRAPECHEDGALAIARIDLGGRGVDVAALHLNWPWPYRQHGQIGKLSRPLASLGSRAVLAGDFNAASWSHAVRRVEEAGALVRTKGSGRTWIHRTMPKALRPLVGLPLDHVMTKGPIETRSLRQLKDAGSDHAPLLLQFGVSDMPAREGVEVVVLGAEPTG